MDPNAKRLIWTVHAQVERPTRWAMLRGVFTGRLRNGVLLTLTHHLNQKTSNLNLQAGDTCTMDFEGLPPIPERLNVAKGEAMTDVTERLRHWLEQAICVRADCKSCEEARALRDDLRSGAITVTRKTLETTTT